MIRQKWMWIVTLLFLLLSTPTLIGRWTVEIDNDTYEMVAPYEEIYDVAQENTLTTDDALSQLKTAGLTTVSLNPITLESLESQGHIEIYNEQMMKEIIRLIKPTANVDVERNGYYIPIPENPYYNTLLLDLQPDKITVVDDVFYFLPNETNLLTSIIGYDELAMEQIEQNGLHFILRIGNKNNPTQTSIDELSQLNQTKDVNILFSGEEAIGYPNLERMDHWTNELRDAGFHFYMIEFSKQHGFEQVASNVNYQVIRLHSMNLNNKTLSENVRQAVRAIKERNIRSIYFHLQTDDNENNLENAVAFVSGIQKELPASFHPGNPEVFEEITIPIWIQLFLLVAGICFTYIATSLINRKLVRVAAVTFICLVAFLYFLFDWLILLQGFALIIAIITPIYAVLGPSFGTSNKIGVITLQYVKAIGISFIGIGIVAGLLNGNAFLSGVEGFRGVKLVYIVPILFTGVFLFWKQGYSLLKEQGLGLLNKEVKYWHLLIFLLLAGIGLYYISRTGNAGTVSQFELVIRNTLEELLYIRPRTKEFLIGFPIYLLALYVIQENKMIGKLLLIPGVIGFLSIMNTFTHFHIPLHISLLRTAYSIVIGYVIGVILIFVYKKCKSIFLHASQMR